MRLFLIALCFVLSTPAVAKQSGIYINVGRASVKKSLMAVPPFQFQGSPAVSPNYRQVGTNLFNTFFNDLDVSSYFKFINKKAYLEDPAKVGLRPAPGDPKGFNFKNWKKIGAEFLIRAGYKIQGNKLTLEAYCYYVPQAKVILARTYTGTVNSTNDMAHTFANELIQSLTGKKGWFKTKIVASAAQKVGGWKEIYVMDWDGKNRQKITNHRSISISPNWSPDGKTILYTAYAYHKKQKTRNPDLFSYDLEKSKRFLLSWKRGSNSGGTFDPDGKYIYLTITKNGNPDIYRMTPKGKELRQITKGPLGAMNVEATISPNGKKIAFSSDRSGKPMVWIMDLDGSNPKRLTFAGRYNSTPAWSPDGKKIAFAGFDKGHFDIFIMNANGTGLERLTYAKKRTSKKYSNNESPTFSPDGRHVMFASDRSGKKQLYIINVDGTNERRITFDQYDYFNPKWSWHIP